MKMVTIILSAILASCGQCEHVTEDGLCINDNGFPVSYSDAIFAAGATAEVAGWRSDFNTSINVHWIHAVGGWEDHADYDVETDEIRIEYDYWGTDFDSCYFFHRRMTHELLHYIQWHSGRPKKELDAHSTPGFFLETETPGNRRSFERLIRLELLEYCQGYGPSTLDGRL